MTLLYNHESSTWSLCMQETLLVESQACRRRGKRTRATHIPCRNVSMAPRNIQMAAMDSPVFDYVVFYFLLNNMYGGQWSQGLPRYLNPYTNWWPDSWSCSTLKLNTSSAWWWGFMMIHDYSWWFMTIHNNSRPFIMIHDFSWQFTTILDNLWRFTAVHDSSWPFMTIHDNSWQFKTVHDGSWQIVAAYDDSLV